MVPLKSTIVAVVVYVDRARLTRRGMVELQPGLHSLDFADLPISLDPGSLRASAAGTARARLLGLSAQRSFYSEIPQEQARALEAQMEALQDELYLLEQRKNLLSEQRGTLAGLAGRVDTYALSLASHEMKISETLEVIERIWQQADQVEAAQLPLRVQKRDLDRHIAMLKNQLDQVRSARPRERYTASVELEVLEAGELVVELVYTASGARWEPLYDLRMLEPEDAGATVEVGYLAQVTQTSGENWEDVELTLSTARPAIAGRLPELQAWFISPQPPPMPPRQAAPPAPAAAPGGMLETFALAEPQAVRAPAAKIQPVEEVQAQVEQSGSTVTYRVPGKATIPPDGSAHKVTIARFPLEPQIDYVTAPRLVEAAYRRTKAANASPYTLLPGRANIFTGDEFIGSMQLELIAPQEQIEMYLGVDDRIKVKREMKRRDMDKRLIGNRRRIAYGYEITLENLLAAPVQLRLQDQYPVGRHEEIKTRLESADPRPNESDEMNILTWELELSPGETRTIRFDFTVEHPVNMEVRGLL